jgi:hypothetical protein
MRFLKRRAVVICFGAMLVFFSVGSFAAPPITETGKSAVEATGQPSGLPILSADAPVLAAVALIGLVGIARRRRSS